MLNLPRLSGRLSDLILEFFAKYLVFMFQERTRKYYERRAHFKTFLSAK